MANVADTLLYRHLRNTALPFITAPAPTETSPKFVAGSNLMSSYKGYIERRPGFATGTGLESAPTIFTGPIQKTFSWRRWGSTFYIMLCAVDTVAKVYKLAVGVDASFSLIFTSASSEPFDFVVSNNFCFFGNGTENRKFDGTTVTNWGISVAGGTTSNYAGTVTQAVGGGGGINTWTSLGNMTGAPDTAYALGTIVVSSGGNSWPKIASLTNYGFALAAGSVVSNIQVIVTGYYAFTGGTNVAPLMSLSYAGASGSVASPQPLGSTPGGTITFNGTVGLPSLAQVNTTGFGVQMVVYPNSSLAATFTIFIDSVQLIISTVNVPAAVVSGSAGSFSAANGGYQYVYCYFNASTGHISSPTQPSVTTGNFTSKLNVGVTVVASTDPQVTNIRLFRTTDGGGGVYFEVANSPYPNASGTITDNTADANLSIITAPTFGFNDPPPPMKGMVWFANRIWGFNNASVYFTDWEEMNIGVPEEASVSGPAGNFWNFDSEVTGLSVAQDGVLIFTAGSIFKISGDSLTTFWRTTIATGLGCRNRHTIARLGGLTAFLANTNSVWTTDSTSLTEISQMIQPTLDNIDHTQASMTFHLQGQYRWLLLCDAGHSQTVPFDVNTQQWMPPWTIVGTSVSSGETSPGNWTLLLGQKVINVMLQMTPGLYVDNGSTYSASFTTNLIPIVNEHLSTGSPIIDLFYPQAPEHVAYLEFLGMDTNSILPTSVKFLLDDDPATGSYTDITANIKDAPLRTQGVNVIDKWYDSRKPTGKRCSINVNWAAANTNFKEYTFTMAYRVYR